MRMWSHSSVEVRKMQELIMKTKMETFLEIGCFKFNMSLFFLTHSADCPLVIANDYKDQDPRRRELISELYPTNFKFVLGSSYDPLIVDSIKSILKNRQIDILFIDGSHSPKAIEADTNNYLPLVHPEGFIIWHDIVRGVHEAFEPWFIKQLTENKQISLLLEGSSRIAYIKKREWDRNAAGNKVGREFRV